jgi:hypothetical protein
MLYDVEKISELTKISKVTIYKKFKLNEIQQYIVKKQGKSYVEERGFNLIKQSLNLTNELNDELKCKETETDESPSTTNNEDLIKVKNDLINSLTEQTEFLKQQLGVKDIQIHELHKIVENSQVLLKEKPQQDILQLEEHFQELDTKLMDIKEQMLQRKYQEQKAQHEVEDKKNWFNKILRK